MKALRPILKFVLFTLIVSGFSACLKTEFDVPPLTTSDPDIKAEQIISLEAIMNKRISGDYVKIGEDKYIKGIVVADDKSGNFYKTLVIEDESSDYGVSLLIDEVELHNTYPVGRRVFVNVKDLWISDYNGLPQIGYGAYIDAGRKKMASIPSTIMRKIILPGTSNLAVEPFDVTISQLGTLRLNTLVRISGVQFKNEGDLYADPVTQTTLNRTLTTCANQEILLRNSGFADFAGATVPSGKGTITAIYSIFGSDKQLMIRTIDDVKMTEPRCGSSTGDEPRLGIKALRELYKGATTSAPKSYIQGVVISDSKYKNIADRNLVIQDGDHGIVVRFASNHSFQLGQEIKVVATDVELSEFNALLQLNNVPNGGASLVGSGTLPTPKILTIKEIKDNLNTYESTLVKVKDATLSGGSTYNGNITMTDASGTIILRTGSSATFASSPLPSGNVSITAIVSEFTTSTVTPQLNMRNTTDVEGGGTTGGGDKISIEALKAKYTGTKTTAPDGFIQGVVISDLSAKNIQAKNLVVQDGNFGIVVRLTVDNTIPLGKEVKITTNGVELSEFNKLLQLNNVPQANITVIGDGVLPSPKVLTVAELKASFESLESTLVTILNATISGGTTYSGTLKVTDASGVIDLFCRTDSAFKDTAVPVEAKNITAIVSEFTSSSATTPGHQLNLRNLSDVK